MSVGDPVSIGSTTGVDMSRASKVSEDRMTRICMPGVSVKRSIPITVERLSSRDFVASVKGTTAAASGETYLEAVENLADMAVGLIVNLGDMEDMLGESLGNTLAILEQYIDVEDGEESA